MSHGKPRWAAERQKDDAQWWVQGISTIWLPTSHSILKMGTNQETTIWINGDRKLFSAYHMPCDPDGGVVRLWRCLSYPKRKWWHAPSTHIQRRKRIRPIIVVWMCNATIREWQFGFCGRNWKRIDIVPNWEHGRDEMRRNQLGDDDCRGRHSGSEHLQTESNRGKWGKEGIGCRSKYKLWICRLLTCGPKHVTRDTQSCRKGGNKDGCLSAWNDWIS